MPQERTERVVEGGFVPLDDIDSYLSESIEHRKARVANAVTLLVVGGFLSAPLLYIFAIWLTSSGTSELRSFFDSWFSVLGPVLGAAVGFYFGERRSQTSPEPKRRRRQ